MKREEQNLKSHSFEEVAQRVLFITPMQGDPLLLVKLFDVSFGDVVCLRKKDLSEKSIRFGATEYPWPDTPEEAVQLRHRVLTWAGPAQAKERLYEQRKSLLKAEYDLGQAWLRAVNRFEQKKLLDAAQNEGRVADFIVLGALRCGTSWLHKSLQRHPEVYVRPNKGPHYFPSPNYFLGMNWYKTELKEGASYKLIGDISEGCLEEPEAAQRIFNDIGHFKPKLIISLREPISRAVSHYRLRLNKGEAPPTFEEAIRLHYFRKVFLDPGHYNLQIEKYFDLFPREQFLVIIFDEIKADPRVVLRRVADFLDIEPAGFASQSFEKKVAFSSSIRNTSLHYLSYKLGYLSHIYLPHRGIGRSLKNKLIKWNRRFNFTTSKKPDPIDPKVLRELEEEYGPSNQKLQQLLGVDLSAWNYQQ
ncbi:MAG: sulfotransferase domain-containing protein [Desulfarculaceae bacterium]